ncbi:hypothetical protein ElyMa_004915400 [Elysia marginata]|uniref:BLOC-1-related complex subunit 7 n=1 Tax=Elysia marginata TaxID=1093978 RepID=A0AAV4IW48_9GAST|nr:hypothetical protein ElyMa_004915400 [Elysia marginata]
MGVMSKVSKGTRLSERPKPPIWEDIEADVTASSKDDVVFDVGRSNLPNVSAQLLKEKANASTSSTADLSDLDTSSYDPEKVQASYESVLRLMESYEHLTTVPASLREQYSNLQGLGQDVLGSISQLRELAHSVKQETQAQSSSADTGHGKGKSTRKKKK